MGTHEYVVADVFTKTALEGNPVAVFLDAAALSAERMQQIANEMHLSETVFVLPPQEDGDVRVRIFTPVNELPFAGHPTLGTAIVLSELKPGRDPDGDRHGNGDVRHRACHSGWLRLGEHVATHPHLEKLRPGGQLLAGLGVAAADSALPVEVYHNGPRHVFVGLPSVPELSALQPDQRILARLPDMAANCFAGSGTQWRLRMFSPAYGVVEDAATGSAAGSLAVHLARHGLIPFGEWIEILQGVEIGRPSTMRARATGAPDRIETVQVAGSAIVVARATLHT